MEVPSVFCFHQSVISSEWRHVTTSSRPPWHDDCSCRDRSRLLFSTQNLVAHGASDKQSREMQHTDRTSASGRFQDTELNNIRNTCLLFFAKASSPHRAQLYVHTSLTKRTLRLICINVPAL